MGVIVPKFSEPAARNSSLFVLANTLSWRSVLVPAGIPIPAELQQNVWLKERTLCLGRTGVGYVSPAEEPSGCLYK